MAGTPQGLTLKLYQAVIADVISNVKEAFQDEGVDDQVLQELKQIWETKLIASKALESVEAETETHKLPDQKTVQVYQQPRQQQQQQPTICRKSIPLFSNNLAPNLKFLKMINE
uniref:Transcription initiation factor IIA subunit 1 n=1 Tax=Cacopsylla melanoneura TaxID=428564 RepID=A0A8D8W4G4_9HEMI